MNGAPVFPPFISAETPKSGLVYLRDGIAAYFEYFGIHAVVAKVGLKYRSFEAAKANRVVVIPGNFDGDAKPKARAYGTLNRDTVHASSVVNPRELLRWERPFTLSVWAAPVAGKPDDEEAKIALAEDLLEQTIRAVNATQAAAIVWGDVVLNLPSSDNAFGVELLVSAMQSGPILDVTHDVTGANSTPPGRTFG